jgi:hypothetical protein
MDEEIKASLQVIWEQLNGALFDVLEGDPNDAVHALEDCVFRLESMGIGE